MNKHPLPDGGVLMRFLDDWDIIYVVMRMPGNKYRFVIAMPGVLNKPEMFAFDTIGELMEMTTDYFEGVGNEPFTQGIYRQSDT